MILVELEDDVLEIKPVTQADLDDVLEVYRQCEDFLALGPVATASMEMVLKDLEISRDEGGIYCGIWNAEGKLIGVLDYVLSGYQGDPHAAFLSLMMIGAPYRKQGAGKAIFEAFEREVRKDPEVTVLVSGVQVNNPQAVRFWQRMGFRITGGPKLMADTTTVYDLRKELGTRE